MPVTLERLCRYVSRPPVATEGMALTASGQVRYALKTPYRDGTTYLVLEPRHAAMSWAQRLKRVFGIEIDSCARCGGKLEVIASIEEPEVIAKILAHLEKAAPDQPQVERPLGARAPPPQGCLL